MRSHIFDASILLHQFACKFKITHTLTCVSLFLFHLTSLHSTSGWNGSAVPGTSNVWLSECIAIAECALLGCFCVLLYFALSICSTELVLRYANKETLGIIGTFDGFYAVAALFILLAHVLMICSYKSVIAPENTVIRFINDNTGEDTKKYDETQAADTSRSTMPIWLSLIAMWLYVYALGMVVLLLRIYAKSTGRVPDVISIPTVYLLFIAGTFFYTYRVFDLRTNVMFAAFIAFLIIIPKALGVCQSHGSDVVAALSISILMESYSYFCCTPLKPRSAISGSYAPPVFNSQTGTGSDLEVGGVQEALICGRPAVTHSRSTHDARGAYSIVKDVEGVEDAEGSSQNH